MSISQLESATSLPVYVKSIRTVEDITCKDLTCRTIKADSILVDRDTTSSTGDMIVQDGDMILRDNGDNTVSGRATERRIIFNNDAEGYVQNPSIPDSADTCHIAMKGEDDVVNLMGNIIFRTQDGSYTESSRLRETMRIKGGRVGIQEDDPQATLDVKGKLRVGSETADDESHEVWGNLQIARSGTDTTTELKLCGGDSASDYTNTASMLTMTSRTMEYMGDNFPDMRIVVGNPSTGDVGQPTRFNVGHKSVAGSGNQNEFTMFQFDYTRDPNLFDDAGYFSDFRQPAKFTGGIRGNLRLGRDDQADAECVLQLHDPRLGSMASGQMFIQAGCTSGTGEPLNVGFSTIGWNGYVNGSGVDVIPNPVKSRWRIINDQRGTVDRFAIDSTLGATATGYYRNWLVMDAETGSTEIGGGLFIDYRPVVGARYVRPTETNLIDLGAGSFRWKDIYSANGSINTSDRKKKKDIADLPPARGMEFIKSLRPVEYRFKDGQSGRKHYGLIAQEVEDVFRADGDVDGMGNAIVIKSRQQVPDPDWVKPEGEDTAKAPLVDGAGYDYAMRYTELIAPLIKSIQELEARVADLER